MTQNSLKPIDGLEIFVLMDNISDPFTESDTGVYWNEWEYQHDIKKKEICGSHYCRACIGLSILLKIHHKDKTHTVLFDTGPDANLVVENAARMGVDLREVEALILSHGHFDHYGGTLSVLHAIGKKDLPVYTHPDLFLPRAFGTSVDNLLPVSDNLTIADVEKHGGKVIETKHALSLFDDRLMISGEVPRVTSYETGCADEHRLESTGWVKSPEVVDERCILISCAHLGLGVFTGCGHTGVVNAVKHAQSVSGEENIHFIMGGFHLAGKSVKSRIDPTVNDLKKLDPQYLVTGHCTGRTTQANLSREFGSRHIPYGVGSYLKFGEIP